MDKRRFEDLWSRCAKGGAGDGAGAPFDEIERHYREPHRRYHTPGHVDHCLNQFDAARALMDVPDAVELAIWYHDVIYEVGAADNELQSAQLFLRRARGEFPEPLIHEVHDLIMVTLHLESEPDTLDQSFMVDIDLSSFGMPWERFLQDSVAVRDEFPHISDEEFYPRQREFLNALLARDHFCFTEFFRSRHEEQARENISRYLDDLAQKGLI